MKRITSLLSFFILFIIGNLNAQLVWTEPAFPTPSSAVTVYFDATQGTGGLAGCNCDVYVHTGVITSASTSPSDWKYVFTAWGQENPDWKMEPVSGQPDVYSYEISPSIIEKYGVPGTEVVEKMAFVFRNGNGTLEGKGEGGADIFIDVFPDGGGFTASIVSPSSPSVFTSIGETIPFSGAASASANLSLFDNGTLLTSVDAEVLEYDIEVSSGGTHLIEFVADNGSETITSTFTYVIPGNTVVEPLPTGALGGITDLGNGSARFVLEAPDKEHVFLIGDFNNWQFDTDYQMKVNQNGDFWWIEIDGLTDGEYYAFQYMVDGEIRTGDPYSELILDPANDSWIPDEVFPNLPPYPTGKTTGIVSLYQSGATDYPWNIDNFDRPDQTNLVIYEMLMRDFLVQDYESLTSLLDYFDKLGINAIELMPVNEFDANESWGYNPTYHYALDKYYGTPDAFRAFVDECHARGIAVIVDVVFNHAHEKNPMCLMYWNQQAFRPAADNPWLNEEATHDFNVFFDYNHESPRTQRYVKQVLRHWLEDYKVDGFRFDLSKGFTQTNTVGNIGAWGSYDAERIAVIKEYADEMWATSPGSYAILEHFANWDEEEELSEYGCMLWGGFGIHDEYLEASMGWPSNLNGVSHKSRGWDDAHVVAYMESHDEERMMYKNLEFGNGNGAYQVKDLETALDRVELCQTFFYTVPGPKMLWQFGELGYDFSINTCADGVTVDQNCRLANKPIRWDYTEDSDRVDVYNNFRALMYLRNNYDVFQSDDFSLNTNAYGKTIHLNSSDLDVVVIGNFDMTAMDVNPEFQSTGTWYEYFSGSTLEVTDVNAPLNLQPGEYRIYLSEEVTPPAQVTNDEEVEAADLNWMISPNPSSGIAQLTFELSQTSEVDITVFDLQGRQLDNAFNGTLGNGLNQVQLPALNAGIYLVNLSIDGNVTAQKWVVTE